jgi:hypothetical protein
MADSETSLAMAVAHALTHAEKVDFESRPWGRIYCGTYEGLWNAGVIENGQALPPISYPFVAWSPDGRKIEIRRKRKGLFEVKWPYKTGENDWIPANQRHLSALAEQAASIAALVIVAAVDIRSKSLLRDWATADSSKLERAIDELDLVTIHIDALKKEIRDVMATGISWRNNEDDDDSDDDDDDQPVLPVGPPPSTVTT